jgi:hypothetical protein
MQIIYRNIFEVQWHHDYFLVPGPVIKYPGIYDVRRLVSIWPDDRTQRLMQQYRMVFRNTARGFAVMAEVTEVSPGSYALHIDPEPNDRFSFCWSLNDPLFVNYTNCRVNEPSASLYYLSNRTGTSIGAVAYLNKAVPAFGTAYPGQTSYWLGDTMVMGGKVYEAIEEDVPLVNYAANAAKWKQINSAVVNYINPGDRLLQQGTRFTYTRPNTLPGEWITWQLFDCNNNPVQFTGTTAYRTSMKASEQVAITLDLGWLEQGAYRMVIQQQPAPAQLSFYYYNQLGRPPIAGVCECFINGASPAFTFCKKDPATQKWIIDTPNKTFMIRFRNRLTHWQYLRQDQSIFDQPPDPRPLTWFYSGYTVPGPMGSTIPMPDPTPARIVPEINPVTHLVKNIYSKIYLAN